MQITCSRGSLTCELIRLEPKNPDVLREPSLMLHDNLEGWEMERGGKLRREGIYEQLWLVHAVVWQKPIKHCKAIFLQLKNKLKFKKES